MHVDSRIRTLFSPQSKMRLSPQMVLEPLMLPSNVGLRGLKPFFIKHMQRHRVTDIHVHAGERLPDSVISRLADVLIETFEEQQQETSQ